MTATIICFRCGSDIHLVNSETETSFDVRMVPHTCYRYMIAECWQDGQVIACWTSDSPGKTGPDDMIRDHMQAADEGWKPPADSDGWTYRWHVDKAALGEHSSNPREDA